MLLLLFQAYWRLRNMIKNPYEENVFGRRVNQFEVILEKSKKCLAKMFVKLAFLKLLSNLKRFQYMQRITEYFQNKINKVLKKIGMRALKLNGKDYQVY